MIYLDHAATTNIYDEVLDIYLKSLKEDFSNPSSAHSLGRGLLSNLHEIRSGFLKELGAGLNDNLYFLSSATEGNNTIIKGIDYLESDCIVYFNGDHKSVTETIKNFDKINAQKINLNFFDRELENKIDSISNPKLIIMSLVNNQSGSILNVNELASLFKSKFPKVHIHIDAVQAIGKIDYKLSKDIDSLVFTSHKLGGPKGIAGLYVKKGRKINPLIHGGGQQNGFRSGTEAYSLTLAFYEAFKISSKNRLINLDRIHHLNSFLKNELIKINPQIVFPFDNCSPYILCIIIPGISSDILIRHFETKKVYLASTSACSSKIKGHNSTLESLGINEKYHKNVLRISFGHTNTEKDIESFSHIFKEVWSDIRHLVR